MKITWDNNKRTFAAFWIFGLINNVLYVVILSAAVDLVGPEAPKAIVLLADVLPAFLIKISAPFFVHVIPYSFRITSLIVFSFFGMSIIAFSQAVTLRLIGVMLASLSSGLGEISFLALTHFYGDLALPGFSSGTGAAGLVGSFVFLVLTTWIGLSIKSTLILFSVLPFSYWLTYSMLLPQVDARLAAKYTTVRNDTPDEDIDDTIEAHREGQHTIKDTMSRLTPLILPYMLPLMLVYIFEYIINQGISPTLLFPLDEMPFSKFRDAYVTYGTLYQLGVLISRSSSPFFRVRKLYLPSILQGINLFICILQSLYMMIPNVYIMMVLMFYEGLLGGLSYVNTYCLVLEQVPLEQREFAMGAVGVSDSAGIVVAGCVSLWLEKSLCGFQKANGRPWCDMQ